MTDNLTRDLKFALRAITRARGFAVIAVLSLSLGIGANSLMFSVINGLLFSRPQLEASGDLVEIHRHLASGDYYAVSQHDMDDLRQGLPDAFEGLSGYQIFTGQVGGENGNGTVVLGELVNADYFPLLRLRFTEGRPFTAEEDRAALANPVVVLGYAFAQRHFGTTHGIAGRSVRLNGRSYSVVGVGPKEFTSHTGGVRVDLWAPMAMADHLNPSDPESDNWFLLGRVKPGQALPALSQAMASVAANNDAVRGRSKRTWTYSATPLNDILFTPSFDTALKAISTLLLLVVALVLLVTCSNLAGFLLARAADRRKEMAIRMATGASRWVVIRQMLYEALLLSLAGGTLGLLLANVGLGALLHTDVPLPFPVNIDLKIDGVVLLYTLGVCLVATAFFGVAPAIRATRVAIAPTLRDESAGATNASAGRLRNGLIVAQFAISLVLLVTAGLFIQSMRVALRVDPGFSAAPASIVQVDLRGSGYAPESYAQAYAELRDAVRAVPGVERLTATSRLPMTIGNSSVTVQIPGALNAAGGNEFALEVASVTPNFFDVMGVQLLQGDTFRDGAVGDRENSAIVNKATADRFWPGESPIGRTIQIASRTVTIVGVAGNARDQGLTADPRRMIYLPLHEEIPSQLFFLARGSDVPARVADAMRRALLRVNDQLFVVRSYTLAEHLNVMYFLPRAAAWILSGFAALALLLGSVGLYGAVSHAVSRRSRELAIRLAIGATPSEVVSLVVRSGLILVALGVAFGLVLSVTMSRLTQGLLIDQEPFDTVIVLSVVATLGAVSILASGYRLGGPLASARCAQCEPSEVSLKES